MPQPLSKIMPNANVIIGNAGDRPLARHPELAVLAIEAIASWSNVENFLLNLFIQLFGGNESLAANVFLSLEVQSAKTSAVLAAANSVLMDKPQQIKLLKAILALAKTNEKSRNKLAHWIWGDSPNIPDALLLANPKIISAYGFDQSQIFVYQKQDFISIIQANDRLCGFGLSFNFILKSHPANRDDSLFHELSAEPEIQEKLNHQA